MRKELLVFASVINEDWTRFEFMRQEAQVRLTSKVLSYE